MEFSLYILILSMVFMATAFVANLYSLYHVRFKLKTNKHISRLLIMSTVTLLVPMMMLIVGFLSFAVLGIVQFWTCSLLLVPQMLMFMLGTLSTASISMSRISMARKTAASEAIRHDLIQCLSWIGFVVIMALICLVMCINLVLGEPFTPVVLECLGADTSSFGFHNLVFTLPMSALAFIGLGLSIVYDVKMINFIKDRNTGNVNELKTIKSITLNSDTFRCGAVQMSIGVPLKATALSTFGLIFILCVIAVVVWSGGEMDKFGIIFLLCVIKNCFQMPLIVAFTVKSKANVKPLNQPYAVPQGLQFHE